ncbi:hypothetical protein ADUPG1_013341 [Aduncisulcus paluster]|uniref:E2F/DP family winged-helix DNA-binding domain-containing protein n=1 Tax=Aduncisulcus paluster TaxID=2918883 RepID=A0ABQ5K4M3_9EUKA|nr:hypothetical protein ADUPG1_013341 [Aduncisulcus paluster]
MENPSKIFRSADGSNYHDSVSKQVPTSVSQEISAKSSGGPALSTSSVSTSMHESVAAKGVMSDRSESTIILPDALPYIPESLVASDRKAAEKAKSLIETPERSISDPSAAFKTQKPITKRGSRSKMGLEDWTKSILSYLQRRGQASFKQIHEDLGIDYRRLYDILNVLCTSPMVHKVGKKRDPEAPFVFGDGTPLPCPVDLSKLVGEIEIEQTSILIYLRRILHLQTVLKEIQSGALDKGDFKKIVDDIHISDTKYLKEINATLREARRTGGEVKGLELPFDPVETPFDFSFEKLIEYYKKTLE